MVVDSSLQNQVGYSLYQFAGKKVLITGASGFVGSHLCQSLGTQGAIVHGVSRSLQSNDLSYLKWWQIDLGNITEVRELFSIVQPDVVYHLASVVTGRHKLDLVLPTFHGNLTSTVNLLTAATEFGGCHRIVLASSLEEPELQEAGAIPHSPYGAAKWASSSYGRMFHSLYKTPVAIARLFMIYGPAQPDINKLIPYMTLSLLQGKAPKVSSGRREIDWIYIDDVIEGLLALVRVPNVEGCTVDLGSGTFVSIRSIAEQLVQLLNSEIKPLYGALPDRPPEPIRFANVAHTYKTLGWKPKTSLEDGLRHTIAWYKEYLSKSLV
ncbi:NAD(P)-dependent oxidoreductase [Leptothermofonsia sichuanensis E412]|uniref:NAD-dependent epimerase/dehydratase family protein n=1 Tax=Leptothermofonsia sichuanensis TaxID=2917832 RepID=UPI001CA748A2|nr:NAD(P)-dependent oxidoreductase [Leptothermofonsia sichuanensis]QZZ22111.1 NAD(P)-dependent oxidoreductase [Leptothermofonsia sichuanensis E412]